MGDSGFFMSYARFISEYQNQKGCCIAATALGLFIRLLFLCLGLGSQGVIKDTLSDTYGLGCYLQQLIICDELKAVLKGKLSGRYKSQCIIGAAGTGIGQVLLLADIYYKILYLGRCAYYHALVNGCACADKQ